MFECTAEVTPGLILLAVWSRRRTAEVTRHPRLLVFIPVETLCWYHFLPLV